MNANDRIAKFENFISFENIECHFDQNTGIMKVYYDDTIDVEDLPTDAEFMELFAHRRQGQQITGLVVFPKSAAGQNRDRHIAVDD